jgi:DNA polymerase III epsilon subunit
MKYLKYVTLCLGLYSTSNIQVMSLDAPLEDIDSDSDVVIRGPSKRTRLARDEALPREVHKRSKLTKKEDESSSRLASSRNSKRPRSDSLEAVLLGTGELEAEAETGASALATSVQKRPRLDSVDSDFADLFDESKAIEEAKKPEKVAESFSSPFSGFYRQTDPKLRDSVDLNQSPFSVLFKEPSVTQKLGVALSPASESLKSGTEPPELRGESVKRPQLFIYHINFTKFPGNLPLFRRALGDNPVRIFFDTETTGISAEDRIIELAFVKRNYATMHETRFYALLNPDGRRSAPKAYEAHKIRESWLRNKPKFSDIARELLEFIGSRDTLVAHNAPFDKRMLNGELVRAGFDALPEDRFDCSLATSRRIYPGEKNDLSSVCERHGVDLSSREACHGAMVDALLLADMYPLLMADLAELNGEKVEKL